MYKKLIAAGIVLFFSLCSFTVNKKQNLNIIFIGDSITFGANMSHPETTAPPVLTSSFLGRQHGIGKVQFANLGVCGYTTIDFLPSGAQFGKVKEAADSLYKDKDAKLVFSIMLGTNDSAIEGTNGAPIPPNDYRNNLKTIIDKLLADYPGCRVVINYPTWYSPNTYNGAKYLQEGLNRLQTYFPEISRLVKIYELSNPGRVFTGDTKAFNYFKKNYRTCLVPEEGKQGTFHLHPNEKGAAKLAEFWSKAIYKVVK